ncbi:MAG: tRNA pseudouridine(55) synthase TruB, partial [Candidatus Margulisiibacteriota bacterium]
MDGIIIVDKPSGWTSFDVVAKIRSISHEKRVGHSGTLDPMATGLLPVFLGKATKFIKYFIGGDKGYLGEMILGVRTNTGDTEGERIPDYRKIRKRESEGQNIRIDKEEIEKVFQKYVGEMAQVPPMYSAVKVNGQRLYKLARKGITINREPRKVVIYKLKLIGSSFKGFETQSSIEHQASIDDTSIANDNRITFYVECSKGTYIRQLVMDIG